MNAGLDILTEADYRALLQFRTGLRRFLGWSAERAREAGLTASQHQLLLAVRGHPGAQGPTISDLAEYLLLRHHSTVELIDRAVRAGLVERVGDADDQRVVRLRLSPVGSAAVESLAAQHRAELERLRPRMEQLWRGLERPPS